MRLASQAAATLKSAVLQKRLGANLLELESDFEGISWEVEL